MASQDRKAHWEDVYHTKTDREANWYEETPTLSLELIRATGATVPTCVKGIPNFLRRNMAGQGHEFGGPWTEEKLDGVARYLQAYTTALRNQPFRRMYIDAFAGTGYCASKRPGETVRGLFPLPKMTELAKGSARRALEVEPPASEETLLN